MYYHLLRAQLQVIGLLEKAHLDTEKMYMDSQEAIPWEVPPCDGEGDNNL